jgi:hypothetical protein
MILLPLKPELMFCADQYFKDRTYLSYYLVFLIPENAHERLYVTQQQIDIYLLCVWLH